MALETSGVQGTGWVLFLSDDKDIIAACDTRLAGCVWESGYDTIQYDMIGDFILECNRPNESVLVSWDFFHLTLQTYTIYLDEK